MARTLKTQQTPRWARLFNIVIALVALAIFFYAAFTGSINTLFFAIFSTIFIVWLLFSLYLRDAAGFGRNLINSIIGILLLFFLYFFITSVFVGIVYFVYNAGYVGADAFNYLLDAASLIPLGLAVFIYLMLYDQIWMRLGGILYAKRYSSAGGQSIPGKLGFGIGTLSLRNIGIGILIFAIILAIEVAISLVSDITSVQVNTNAAMLFVGAPVWFYIFAAVIEPINEEIVFRGFMVPRLGILPSAILFGLAHYTYNSSFGVEVLAAFLLGVISGYVYKKTGSIWPGIIAHILINSVAAISIFSS